ncbi:DUF6548 family protein [Ruminococcus flavefaciens]|uniref:DUF6548 family protein n=1 Tax=Ruminococcus flavefaciens TaxID=1265 RepID=UPI00046403C3|nr:DUF6548 family protein [Ruminococcus flavefaciens]
MRESDFLSLYIKVDKFIKDAYSSNEGVSEYIRQMEINCGKGYTYVQSWQTDYNELKRVRRLRNQLVHDDIFEVEEADYNWLEYFYNRLFAADDPMAKIRKVPKPAQRKPVQQNTQLPKPNFNQQVYQQTETRYDYKWHTDSNFEQVRFKEEKQPQKRPSLCERIIRFFFG